MTEYISDQLLHTMHSFVYDLDVEICSNMISDDNELILEDISVGIKEDGRNLCQLEKYTTYTFHSHPLRSWSYPSFDDINKVSKNLNIKVSIVATFWGIWEISKEIDDIKINLNKEKINEDILWKLGGLTKTDDDERKETGIKSMTWSEKIHKVIDHYVRKLNKYLGPNIYVKFTPWKNVLKK